MRGPNEGERGDGKPLATHGPSWREDGRRGEDDHKAPVCQVVQSRQRRGKGKVGAGMRKSNLAERWEECGVNDYRGI